MYISRDISTLISKNINVNIPVKYFQCMHIVWHYSPRDSLSKKKKKTLKKIKKKY